ncbi:disulfide bond formation protein B [Tropicimonas sp.]|uniref:disulfide bond formation protein B n=1 Tax=Tropicimonas sp. TaxID=2067044 RepID=UPI003A839871
MTRKSLLWLAFAFSVLTLAGAYFFQYAVGILPCHLCLLQRYPHAAMAAFALIGLVWRGPVAPFLGAITAVWSLGLAIYHSGVERKLWAGPADCTGGQDLSGLSGSDLLSTEIASPIIRCDEVSFDILGLSFANMNAIGSLLLIVIWVRALRKS